jgi:hypothetical protein
MRSKSGSQGLPFVVPFGVLQALLYASVISWCLTGCSLVCVGVCCEARRGGVRLGVYPAVFSATRMLERCPNSLYVCGTGDIICTRNNGGVFQNIERCLLTDIC